MPSEILKKKTVSPEDFGKRLDQVAAELFPDYSRSRIQGWIKEGGLLVDGEFAKPNSRLRGGEVLLLEATVNQDDSWEPQEIPLDIIYEDADILVINKPAGLVVHPGAGNWEGTLLNGLLHYDRNLASVPRAGIVHRLDKDTSGLMVVAKTVISQHHLVAQMASRAVKRSYHALVHGELGGDGSIETQIGRHPHHRTKMAVVQGGGKQAITYYNVISAFQGFTHVELSLKTGRTHQIRVHMAHMGYPLVGDQVYGRPISLQQLKQYPNIRRLATFPRQALHALRLGLVHPTKGNDCLWEVDLAQDVQELIDNLGECE